MAKPKKKPSRPKHRASWKGHLSFGLVSFPVQAFNARSREQGDIHFHQLHEACHRRVRYQKVCPVHGEIPSDEIVSGYEYKKGRYVEIDPDELDALRTEAERSLTIDAFVAPDVVDPLYFDGRMYYLVPDGRAAEEPYLVLLEAMQREERFGIGQVVFSGKDQLALVRPLEDVLHMAMLNYDEELRQAQEVLPPVKKPRDLNRKVHLAQTLIRNWAEDDFDFTEYDDRYREKVRALIDAKIEGREIVAPEEETEEAEIVNLMDALKRSVGQALAGKQRKGRSKRRRRTA
jgi:DNA end-binding protein Ku